MNGTGTRRVSKAGAFFCTTIVAMALNTGAAQAQNWVVEKGVLPRGTTYEMRKPNNWNGVLIDDLDFAGSPDVPRYLVLLNNGYAVAGTARRADRTTAYDPAHELIDLINVMDMFAAKFGKPKRTIQLGFSGGGHDTLAFVEQHPDRVDGAVAACAHTPVWLMNSELDSWFTLQTLIAPNLQVVNLPAASNPGLTTAWRAALADAQKTAIGRARIALATTVGQHNAWISATTPEPDPNNIDALQNSMYQMFDQTAAQVGGQSRYMFEQSVPGQPSWNTGVDYVEAFKRGDPAYQRAVKKLYEAAGASLDDDLAKLNAADRVAADPKAVQWWSYPGRTVVGEPKVPVLRIHTNGDGAVPISLVAGYDALVKTMGHQDLYRRAFVNRDGHCNFTGAEVIAAVETVMQRLDNGEWGPVTPTALNKLGAKLDPTSTPKYFNYKQFKYNRTWVPTPQDYLGLFGQPELIRNIPPSRALEETGEAED